MPEPPTIEARLAALEAQAKRVGAVDSRIPLLATEFDIETAVFPPAVSVYGAASSVGHLSWQGLLCNSEYYDTDSMHDTATNSHRFVASTAGKYVLTASVSFAAAAGGNRRLVRFDYSDGGGTRALSSVFHAGDAIIAYVNISAHHHFAAGDSVDLDAWQDSGGALNVTPTEFSMTWVAP